MAVELISKIECDQSIVFVFKEQLDKRPVDSVKLNYQRIIVSRCLSQILGYEKVELEHMDNGAPYLPKYTDQYISISHSKQWYAIQLSGVDRVGVDIQIIKENIYSGRSYFINDEEERGIELNNLNLNLIWSAKEALYKLKKGEVENYRNSITILAIKENQITARVDTKIISCDYTILNGVVLVYVN